MRALILALIAVVTACAGEAGPVVLLRDGTLRRGALSISQGRPQLDGKMVDAVALSCPGPVPDWLDQGVLLASGEILRGSPRQVQNGQVTVASDLCGALVLPLGQVSALILSPLRLPGLDSHPGQPGLLLANGQHLGGAVAFLNPQTVGIDTGRKVQQLPRERCSLLALAPRQAGAGGGAIRLASGDLLRGLPQTWDSEVCVLPRPGGELRLPSGLLRSWWREDADCLPLSRLAPVAGSAERDRLPGGGWLASAGRRWDAGVAVAVGDSATWELDGSWSALVAELAVPCGLGICEFAVTVDGRRSVACPRAWPGMEPKAIRIPLDGARRLELAVAPTSDSRATVGTGLFAWSLLVK